MTTFYNEINLGFARLIVYTSELGIENVMMKSQEYDFKVPSEEIHSEEINE